MAHTVWCVAINIQYENLIASTFRAPQALHRINVCYTRLRWGIAEGAEHWDHVLEENLYTGDR